MWICQCELVASAPYSACNICTSHQFLSYEVRQYLHTRIQEAYSWFPQLWCFAAWFTKLIQPRSHSSSIITEKVTTPIHPNAHPQQPFNEWRSGYAMMSTIGGDESDGDEEQSASINCPILRLHWLRRSVSTEEIGISSCWGWAASRCLFIRCSACSMRSAAGRLGDLYGCAVDLTWVACNSHSSVRERLVVLRPSVGCSHVPL